MLRFVLRRCALVVPSLLGLLVVTFLLIHAVPSDPAMAMAGDAATPEQVEHLRQQYGLNRPLWEQFFVYVGKVAHLDFGESAFSRRPVTVDLAQRLPATLELTFCALAISIFVGVPLGVIAALNHNAWPDYLLRIFSVLGIAVGGLLGRHHAAAPLFHAARLAAARGELASTMPRPGRVTGFLVIDCLIAGRWEAFVEALRHLALPAVTLALGGLATIVRFTRAGVLDTLQQDFVFYERAMGYRWLRLVWVFVLRNSVTATVTQIGLLFGGLIAGGVVVESIFDWPGIGSYTVQAILTGDRQVMLAMTLLIGTVYAAVNILVDVVHGLLDPRLMEQG